MERREAINQFLCPEELIFRAVAQALMPRVKMDEVLFRAGQVWQRCELLGTRLGCRVGGQDHSDVGFSVEGNFLGSEDRAPWRCGICGNHSSLIVMDVGSRERDGNGGQIRRWNEIKLLDVIEAIDASGRVVGDHLVVFIVEGDGAGVRTGCRILGPTVNTRVKFCVVFQTDDRTGHGRSVNKENALNLAIQGIADMIIALAMSWSGNPVVARDFVAGCWSKVMEQIAHAGGADRHTSISEMNTGMMNPCRCDPLGVGAEAVEIGRRRRKMTNHVSGGKLHRMDGRVQLQIRERTSMGGGHTGTATIRQVGHV